MRVKNDTQGRREEEAGGGGSEEGRGWVDINWETNVKGSTSHCKLGTERSYQKAKSCTGGWEVCVCWVEGHGEKPIQWALKGHLAFWLLPVFFPYKGFPFILCHASHVLLRRSMSVFMSVGVPYPEEGGLMCLCVHACVFPSLLSINNIGESERQGDRSGCLLWYKARCFSVCSPKLCEHSALKYSLPLRLQTISCPKGLHGPPWPNLHIPLTAIGNWNFQIGGFRAWTVREDKKWGRGKSINLTIWPKVVYYNRLSLIPKISQSSWRWLKLSPKLLVSFFILASVLRSKTVNLRLFFSVCRKFSTPIVILSTCVGCSSLTTAVLQNWFLNACFFIFKRSVLTSLTFQTLKPPACWRFLTQSYVQITPFSSDGSDSDFQYLTLWPLHLPWFLLLTFFASHNFNICSWETTAAIGMANQGSGLLNKSLWVFEQTTHAAAVEDS